jgi:hypothetical protein
MEPGEALTTAAQIAVALAGFAGVVVGSDWAQADPETTSGARIASNHHWATIRMRKRAALITGSEHRGTWSSVLRIYWSVERTTPKKRFRPFPMRPAVRR